MQVKGTIKVKGHTIQVSDKFSKREFVVTVVENDPKYAQHISIQLSQDKCDLLNNINVGDEVEVSINLKGREWTDTKGEVKYFNTLEAWKIDVVNTTQPQPAPVQATEEPNDDLPF